MSESIEWQSERDRYDDVAEEERVTVVDPSGRFVKELTDPTWDFPVVIEDGGQEYELVFCMRPYSAQEMKELLIEMSQQFEAVSKNKTKVRPIEQSVCAPFFDRHFVKMLGIRNEDGSEPSIEEQKQWIDENDPLYNLKASVVLLGYGDINSVHPETGGFGDGKMVLRMGRSNVDVRCFMRLWNAARERAERLECVFWFSRPTDRDRREHERGLGASEIQRRKQTVMWHKLRNYDVTEQLFDRLVRRVEGFTVRGRQCSEENVEEWKGLIPFWFKVFAVDELFRGVQIKKV